MIYDFDAADMPLAHDACVIVETDRGEALGWTVGEPEDREPHTDGVLRRIIRLVSATDEARRDELKKREKEALRFCAQAARQRNLPMKVIAVEWAHSGEKAAFYFSSEDRIDFRELVRELAQKFRIRVEMRQVGPRDEAKIIGAMGPCGRETCCSSWMRAFTPVSIKMAKDQGLSIQPQKVTGVCGRLLCCLAYEQDTYKELRRKLPRLGKQIITPRGPGRVIDVLVLREAVRVFLDEGGPPVEFLATEVRAAGTAAPVADETDNETDAPEALTDLPATPSAPKPAPSIAARPTPAAPPRIGRDRRESRGGSGPAAPLPTIGGSAREEGGAQLPPRRDQRPPRTDGQRPQQQKREARPPRPPQGPPPNREPRPPRPEGQPNRDARPPRVEGQSPQPNREPRPPRPEGQQPQQQRPQGRPNRPPRPPPSAPAAANITPTGAASAPTEAKPAGESEGGPAREGQRNRHRNRRRGGGGGGGGGGGAPPSGGGGPPPAGPAPV
jgi:cell fate regulator YaaT (PSP1 superfamily)